MHIHDYESGRSLLDVDIRLSRAEVEELQLYLSRLLQRPDIGTVHISEVSGAMLSQELSITIDDEKSA